MADTDNMVVKASQDFQTIEDFVNLPADSEVYPRLLPAVNVGTLAGAREAIFKAGGLPATPFDTKEQMLTDGAALAENSYALVLGDDTPTKNGYYQKIVGVWTYLAYNPQVVSKAYTDAAIDNLVSNDAERHYPANTFNLEGGMARDGTVPTSYPTWRRTERLRVRAGDTVKVNTSAESTQRLPAMVFFDEDGDLASIVEIPSPTQGYKIFEGIAPVDGYVSAQHASTGFESSYMTINEGRKYFLTLDEVKAQKYAKENDLLGMQSAVFGNADKRLAHYSQASFSVVGGVTPDGREDASGGYINWRKTELIPVVAGDVVYVTTSIESSQNPPAIIFYDSDGNYLSGVGIGGKTNGYKTFSAVAQQDGFVKGQHAPTGFDGSDLNINSNDLPLMPKIDALLAGDTTNKKFEVCKGAYSWWNEPQSLQVSGIHPHTFVGAVDIQSGWGKAVKIDTSKEGKNVSSSFVQSAAEYIPDAHNAAVTTIAGDRLVTFYAGHNDNQYLAYRVSSDLNIENLGEEKRINLVDKVTSYSQVHYNHNNSTLYVAFRAGINFWCLASSTDFASETPNWSVKVVFSDTEQMYLRLIPTYDGSAFRCLLTKNAKFSEINGLWYASIDIATGDISTANNTVVGNISTESIVFSQLTKIYTAPARMRLYDAKTELTKLPILLQTFDVETDGGAYRYVEYDLTTFAITNDVAIVQSGKSLGANYYYGGAHFSNVTAMGNGLAQSASYSNIYTARESGGAWYIEEWKTLDSGTTWTLSREIDKSDTQKLWRPRVPFNRDVLPSTPNQIELTWCKGAWSSYTNYDASVWALKR